ncbi:TolB family protein [Curtobacterium sp. USHLN213]|uniref:TolB family protein n=1 Tax=Curtobacterium sp. USHLN213 TaxID=3081255 RepID=UPI0030191C23
MTDEQTTVPARELLPGQVSRIRIHDTMTGTSHTVFESSTTLFEAPNWTREGNLIVNGQGALWTMPSNGSEQPQPIEIDGIPDLNNDHVLHPSHESIFISANDFQLYEAPITGGSARRITAADGALYFLHGVTPDGETLAYVRLEPADGDWWASATIHEIGIDGTGDRAVTTHPGPADGPEYSQDGRWVYFNTEQFEKGRAQIARIRPDGSELTQLTFDERVNWFPHLAPVGGLAVYLSFPEGTAGHPADKAVRLVLVRDNDWQNGTVVEEFNGGQGTINVNSWSPDGTAFAYVDYPLTTGQD